MTADKVNKKITSDTLQEIVQRRFQDVSVDFFLPVVPLSCCLMTSSDREVVRREAEWRPNRISLVIYSYFWGSSAL